MFTMGWLTSLKVSLGFQPPRELIDGIEVTRCDAIGSFHLRENGQPPLPVKTNFMKVDTFGYFLYFDDLDLYYDFDRILDIRLGMTPPNADAVRYARERIYHEWKREYKATSPHVNDLFVCISVATRESFSADHLHHLYLMAFTPGDARLIASALLKVLSHVSHRSNPSVLTLVHKEYNRLRIAHRRRERVAMDAVWRAFNTTASSAAVRHLLSLPAFREVCGSGQRGDAMHKEDFSYDCFFTIFMFLIPRFDVFLIFHEIKVAKTVQQSMTIPEFFRFLSLPKFQFDSHRHPRKFPPPNRAEAEILIRKYKVEEDAPGYVSCDTFQHYLLSEDNLIVNNDWYELDELQMKQPLSHYIINSSHNTYLTGHQLSSNSLPQMYRIALLAGCRCLELDCWPGESDELPDTPEPIITHGKTLCTSVHFRDCVQAIQDTAFVVSQYPVILSFENHCETAELQNKMAAYCEEAFGDNLLKEPLADYPLAEGVSLPSPAELQGKILIKSKKLKTAQAATLQDAESASSELDAPAAPEPVLMPHEAAHQQAMQREREAGRCRGLGFLLGRRRGDPMEALEEATGHERNDKDKQWYESVVGGKNTGAAVFDVAARSSRLSDLINYIQPVRFKSLKLAIERNMRCEMSSFSEDRAWSVASSSPAEFVLYTTNHTARIYPRGTRVKSSNYMPHKFWSFGAQMVCLNYQTMDCPMQMNMALFALNRNSGYLLKPRYYRQSLHFDPMHPDEAQAELRSMNLTLEIISGLGLSKSRRPVCVEVEIFGIPADSTPKKIRTRFCAPADTFSPTWREVVLRNRTVLAPELAVLRIAAVDSAGQVLGVRFLPVQLVNPGYRYVPLLNAMGRCCGVQSLFVRVLITYSVYGHRRLAATTAATSV